MATANLCTPTNEQSFGSAEQSSSTMTRTDLQGLAYGAISAPWGRWLKMEITLAYGNAAEQVYKRINYNANAWRNTLPFFEDYSIDNVDAVLGAYAKGVKDKVIPIYKDDGNETDKKRVYSYIQQQTGLSENFVRLVMYEAYWSVYGTNPVNPTAFITDPFVFMTQTLGPFDKARDEIASTLTILKWLAILGVGAYALSQFNVFSRTVRGQ